MIGPGLSCFMHTDTSVLITFNIIQRDVILDQILRPAILSLNINRPPESQNYTTSARKAVISN